MTARELRFDGDTRITVSEPTTLQDVHLEDLSWVLDITTADGAVTECVIDLPRLLRAVTVYSAEDRFRYGWRRRWRDERREQSS